MWKPLQKSPPFFIKHVQDREDLHVDITDYQKCWTRNFNRQELLKILQESNDGLEFDDENELINRGLDMLSNPESLKKVIILPDSNGSTNIVLSKQYEITLKIEFSLVESSSEHFFQMIVQPLLKTICDLRSSQHELRTALLKKDREIEEYKIEGRAPRRLITTIYDDVGHMRKYTAFEEYFGTRETEISELLKSTIEAKKRKAEPPAIQPTSTKNEVKPELITKVEKSSQEPTTKENPVQININESISETKPEVEILKTEPLPTSRKRQRNRLNL